MTSTQNGVVQSQAFILAFTIESIHVRMFHVALLLEGSFLIAWLIATMSEPSGHPCRLRSGGLVSPKPQVKTPCNRPRWRCGVLGHSKRTANVTIRNPAGATLRKRPRWRAGILKNQLHETMNVTICNLAGAVLYEAKQIALTTSIQQLCKVVTQERTVPSNSREVLHLDLVYGTIKLNPMMLLSHLQPQHNEIRLVGVLSKVRKLSQVEKNALQDFADGFNDDKMDLFLEYLHMEHGIMIPGVDEEVYMDIDEVEMDMDELDANTQRQIFKFASQLNEK